MVLLQTHKSHTCPCFRWVVRGAFVMLSSRRVLYLRDISQSELIRDCVCGGIIRIFPFFAREIWAKYDHYCQMPKSLYAVRAQSCALFFLKKEVPRWTLGSLHPSTLPKRRYYTPTTAELASLRQSCVSSLKSTEVFFSARLTLISYLFGITTKSARPYYWLRGAQCAIRLFRSGGRIIMASRTVTQVRAILRSRKLPP